MTQLRVLKLVTVYGFLILVITAWVYKFDPHGYNRTLDTLLKSIGANAYIFIAIFSVASLVSIPLVGIAGIIGIISSWRLGRSAFVCGLLCFVLSAANFELWKKYGGVPTNRPGTSGPTPVTQSAGQDPPRHPSSR
jgi:hypothetical protein